MKPCDAPLPPPGARAAMVAAHRGGTTTASLDWLADEVPVALVFNGISHAVMMATPADLEDLALGFGLTEGVLASPAELYGIDVEQAEAGWTVSMEVSSACFARLKQRRRALAGRTGCGLCGTEALTQVCLTLPPLGERPAIAPHAISRALDGLRQAQALQQTTGATHAAAWCTREGEVRWAREDVGRHNALDKVIGAGTRAQQDLRQGLLCVTSRASFEMVQKAVAAGVGTLAAVSAPTDMARRLAQSAGLCLVGFARGRDLVAYSHVDRVLPGMKEFKT